MSGNEIGNEKGRIDWTDLGSLRTPPAVRVIIVSTAVTPMDALAGTALRFTQKVTHEMATMRPAGKYTCTTNTAMFRSK